ncbi:hypothetical protein ACI79O_09195 [Geodermatophilus sp. SYSU D00696]
MEVDPVDHAGDVDPVDHRVHVQPGGDGVEVDPVDHAGDVDPVHHRVEVQPGGDGVQVDPVQHAVHVDPVDHAGDVDPVHHRVEVEPGSDGVDVEPGGHRIEVDPVQHGVEVDPRHHRVHVEHRGQPVEVHELADEAGDVEPGEHCPGHAGDQVIRGGGQGPHRGGCRAHEGPRQRSVQGTTGQAAPCGRQAHRQPGEDTARVPHRRLRRPPHQRGRDRQDRVGSGHRVLRGAAAVRHGNVGRPTVRPAAPRRRVRRVHGHAGPPSDARLMRPPRPSEPSASAGTRWDSSSPPGEPVPGWPGHRRRPTRVERCRPRGPSPLTRRRSVREGGGGDIWPRARCGGRHGRGAPSSWGRTWRGWQRVLRSPWRDDPVRPDTAARPCWTRSWRHPTRHTRPCSAGVCSTS